MRRVNYIGRQEMKIKSYIHLIFIKSIKRCEFIFYKCNDLETQNYFFDCCQSKIIHIETPFASIVTL